LQDVLYRDWYCAVGEKPTASVEHRDLAEMLRAAHASTRQWEQGWHVANVSSHGRVAVTRGRERRVVHVIDCLPADGAGADICPGGETSVTARRCSESLNPGDWVTFSESWHKRRKDPILRIYWNLYPNGAAMLVKCLTSALPASLPYFFKCPRLPMEFDRRDAAVLYLPRNEFAAMASVLADTARALGSHLEASVPALTLGIARGVGLAEDPAPEDQSFGTSRCALLADAITTCIARAESDSEQWRNAVHSAFTREGIPVDRPWADSADSPEYVLP
jgi:hypothetical protein